MLPPRVPTGAARPTTGLATHEAAAELSQPLRSSRTRLVQVNQAGPPARPASPTQGTRPPRASLDAMPPELLLHMPLDPVQMQSINRHMHGVFQPHAAAQTFIEHLPPVASFEDVDRALYRLQRGVPPHLRHGPLAALCGRLNTLPLTERLDAFHLLFNAATTCPHDLDPLVELSVGVRDWPEPTRTTARQRLDETANGPLAQTLCDMDTVVDLKHDLPAMLERIMQLAEPGHGVALGRLAQHLFSLPFLGSHDFAAIATHHHGLPWPPSAAQGLLRRIGWIPPEADAAMRKLAKRSS